jgi:subtilase family serine protease
LEYLKNRGYIKKLILDIKWGGDNIFVKSGVVEMSLERGNLIERHKTRIRGNSVYSLLKLDGIMPWSWTVILTLTITLFSSGSVSQVRAAESGEIISVNPSTFSPGIPTQVTICVRNTGSTGISARVVCASKPAGWTVSPDSSPWRPLITGSTYCISSFTVTAPMSGGNGTIVWELYSDDFLFDHLLDTYYQSVNAYLPDLIVEDIDLTPTNIEIGTQTLTATIVIRNIGRGSVGPFSTFMRISDQIGNTRYSNEIRCPSLSSGQRYQFQVPLQVTFSSIGHYSFDIFAEADCNHEVFESDESNNTRNEHFEMQLRLPDLIVEDLHVQNVMGGRQQVSPGENRLNVTVIVRNVGQGESGPCKTGLSLQGVGVGVSHNLPPSIPIPSMVPGARYTAYLQVYAYVGNSQGGRLLFSAEIDNKHEVIESNEENNTRVVDIPFVHSDLIVTGVWTEPATLVEGQSYITKATVKNQGTATASAGLLADIECFMFVDGSKVGEGNFDDLGPGASITVSSGTLTAPPAGSHSLKAKVDGNGEVAESNESNNESSTIPFTVNPPSVHILSPNGGEEYFISFRYSYDITWQTLGAIPKVTIELSRDNGTTWGVLAEAIENTGSFQWKVAETQEYPECLIRVSDATKASILDVSDGSFHIVLICELKYDLDGDCVVTMGDIARLASEWQKTESLMYDLDGDGVVTLSDLSLLASEWLQSGKPII